MSSFFPCGNVGCRTLSLVFCGCFLLVACVLVPYPTFQERLDEKDVSPIKPGETTRMDIIERFGEPNVFDSQRYAVYDKYTTDVGLFFAGFGPGGGSAYGKIKYVAFRVLFEFDANGVVERIVYSQIDYGLFSESGKKWVNGVVDKAGKKTLKIDSGDLEKTFSKSCALHCGRDLAVSHNGDIAMSSRSEVYVFDSKSMRRLRRYRASLPVAFMAKPDYLVARTGNDLSIFSMDREQPIHTFSVPHKTVVMSNGIVSAGQLVALRGYDGKLSLWNRETDALRQPLSIESRSVSYVTFSPDGELLAATTGTGEVIVLEVRTLASLSLTGRSTHAISSSRVRFTPDGKYLASNSCAYVGIWETKAVKQAFLNGGNNQMIGPKAVLLNPYVPQVDSRGCTVAPLSFSKNGRVLAVISSDKSMSFFDVGQAEFVSAFKLDDDETQIFDIAFNPVNNDIVILTGSAIELWRPKPDSNLSTALMAP